MEDKLEQKWAVIAILDEHEQGYVFDRSSTPLHITLAGVFAIDLSGNELTSLVNDSVGDIDKMTVVSNDTVNWREGLDVVLIENTSDIIGLLMSLHEALVDNGVVYNEPHYSGEGHTLHSTVQNGRAFEGPAVIDKLAVIDMFPDGDGHKRRIHSIIELGQQ